MNAVVKLIIGILITTTGLAWYIFHSALTFYGLQDSLYSLNLIFSGIFGAFLILFGLLLTWIEAEEVKESLSERKAKKKRKK
ncbi:MAG TPA: hypothetical protein EYP80_00275 [Candidatus Aenigmarchaeota archaeon]|nr:hypothetical protein [Candidatus Aenigmarchaeota archaeon]